MAEVVPDSARDPRFQDRFGSTLYWLARALALAGGVVLILMTLMSVASILGRWLFGKPLAGDYEMAQLAGAVAVSSFLPYCQLRGGHVLVDFFTVNASARTKAALDFVGGLLVAITAGMVFWRMAIGLVEIRAAGEQTMIVSIPIWYAYAAMVPSFGLFALAALYNAVDNLGKAIR